MSQKRPLTVCPLPRCLLQDTANSPSWWLPCGWDTLHNGCKQGQRILKEPGSSGSEAPWLPILRVGWALEESVGRRLAGEVGCGAVPKHNLVHAVCALWEPGEGQGGTRAAARVGHAPGWGGSAPWRSRGTGWQRSLVPPASALVSVGICAASLNHPSSMGLCW